MNLMWGRRSKKR